MAKKIFHTCYSACRAFTEQQWHDYLEKEEKMGTKFGKYIVNDCDICINPDVIHFEVNKVWCYANIKWADFGNGWFAYGIDCNTNDGGWSFGVSYIDDKCAHLEWKRNYAARSKKDAAMSRVGIPDYLMIFRKDGEHKHPVHCDITVDTWQKWASPVWMDIDYSNTLNAQSGRDQNDEKHICPLQLETIERAISLWSNEGDTVLTPFMGIGSEVYSAIKLKRYGVGFELKESYFNEAMKNCKSIEFTANQPTLFS